MKQCAVRSVYGQASVSNFTSLMENEKPRHKKPRERGKEKQKPR